MKNCDPEFDSQLHWGKVKCVCCCNLLMAMKQMIDWFNVSDAQKFGAELALFFIERIPPQASTRKVKTLSKKKDVLDKMFFKIEHFKRQHTLNFYKKAKLGNAFQWALKDAGYDTVFIDELTNEILLKLG